MIQSRRRLRLALEAGQCLRVSGDFFGQKLEGNEAMQPRVLGFIHHTHTAAPELLDDTEVRDGLADHEAETSPVGDEHGSSLPGSSQRARPSSERNEYAGRAFRVRKNSFPRAASRPAHSQKPSPHGFNTACFTSVRSVA